MAEFGKKGVMGYKVLPGGRNDSESTHAILSLEEYDELLAPDCVWRSVISMRRSSRQRGR